MNELKKVLFTAGMSNDYMIIITDAPKERLEAFCYSYNEQIENGKEITAFNELKKEYYLKFLADSEIDNFDKEDIEIIGYSEAYDLFDYYKE